jgi:hypothetical protein
MGRRRIYNDRLEAERMWRKTPSGRAYYMYQKLRERCRRDGITLLIDSKVFRGIYLKAEKCAICGRPFGKAFRLHKSVMAIGEPCVADTLKICHVSCHKKKLQKKSSKPANRTDNIVS